MYLQALCRYFTLLLLPAAAALAQAPPYSGTIFNFPNAFKDTDSTTFIGISYAGQQRKTVYDRRPDGNITINAYVYTAVFDDAAAPWSIMVNPEFSQDSAKSLAERYARNIGQMPYCLRVGMTGAVIHDGVNPWGGGNPLIIHHGQGLDYARQGIVTETLIHECTHASFDRKYYTADWAAAATADGNYISTYARDNPQSEDHSETFLCWLAIRYKRDRIPAADYAKITATVPNRIKWYDEKAFPLRPVAFPSTALVQERGSGAPGGNAFAMGGRLPRRDGFRLFDARGRSLRTLPQVRLGMGARPYPQSPVEP